jgi:hypothetical protein
LVEASAAVFGGEAAGEEDKGESEVEEEGNEEERGKEAAAVSDDWGSFRDQFDAAFEEDEERKCPYGPKAEKSKYRELPIGTEEDDEDDEE